jgi:hypothetical protein
MIAIHKVATTRGIDVMGRIDIQSPVLPDMRRRIGGVHIPDKRIVLPKDALGNKEGDRD